MIVWSLLVKYHPANASYNHPLRSWRNRIQELLKRKEKFGEMRKSTLQKLLLFSVQNIFVLWKKKKIFLKNDLYWFKLIDLKDTKFDKSSYFA